jgi:hypothetical protein
MNKSQRIYANTGATQTSKYIKFQLEQDVDTIEFMTMNIYTKDAYQDFNSDYGVLVGRVTANGGVGIPNAKISIFIPLTDTDAEIGQINSIYPYRTPRDKNAQGKRYNLLPRVSEYEPNSGTYSPKQPFGSFPIKPEIVTNQYFLDVYKKYYKYTALTNSAGDYMIFGVPVGTQTVHMSVDITDIGKYSMNPASMVTNLGYSPNLFMDNNSKIKPSDDLNDLPNIETQEITVDIIPFWGDATNFTIGVTQQNFRIRSVLDNTFIIFGTAFTDGENVMWTDDHYGGNPVIAETFRITPDESLSISMASKRIGKVTEKIYYYPADVTDAEISGGTADPRTEMVLLDPSQYSAYKRDGDFVFIISCNRNKIVTDDFGNEVLVSSSSPNGIFTQFRGFVTLTITPDTLPMNATANIGLDSVATPFRYTLKFPQSGDTNQSLQVPTILNESINQAWRKQHKLFRGGTIYSVAKFHGTTINNYPDDGAQFSLKNGFFAQTTINVPYNNDPFFNVGVIQTGTGGGIEEKDQYEFPSNTLANVGAAPAPNTKVFGANWMNFSVHFPQIGNMVKGWSHILDVRHNDNFHPNYFIDINKNIYYVQDNTQEIVAGQFNTKWFARSDLHWTDFVEVPKSDIIQMRAIPEKGFTGLTSTFKGKYRNGQTPCPFGGGKINAPSPKVDPKIYFYKGMDTANCIEYLISLGLV